MVLLSVLAAARRIVLVLLLLCAFGRRHHTVDGMSLMIFPNVSKQFMFSRHSAFVDSRVHITYFSNDDPHIFSRKICSDYGTNPSRPSKSLHRCYFPMSRSLLKQRVQLAREHRRELDKIMFSSLQLMVSTDREFAQLVHTFISAIDWALHSIAAQEQQRQQQQQHQSQSQSQSQLHQSSPKQICIIGGPFCAELAFAAALSIPKPFDYEILYVLSNDSSNSNKKYNGTGNIMDMQRLCGELTDSVEEDVVVTKTILSAVFNENLKKASSTSATNAIEINVEVMSDSEFTHRLVTGRTDELISCDIAYIRENNVAYYEQLLALLHQHRRHTRKLPKNDKEIENENEIYLVKEHILPIFEEMKASQRDFVKDCENEKVISAAEIFYDSNNYNSTMTGSHLCDKLKPSNSFRRHYYEQNGKYGVHYAAPVCAGPLSLLVAVDITYFAYAIFSEMTTLSEWEDYQGLSSDCFSDHNPYNMVEVQVGVSRASYFELDASTGAISPTVLRNGWDHSRDLVISAIRSMMELETGDHTQLFESLFKRKQELYSSLCPEPTEDLNYTLRNINQMKAYQILHPNREKSLGHSSAGKKLVAPSNANTVADVVVDGSGSGVGSNATSTLVRVLITYSSRLYEDNAFRMAQILSGLSRSDLVRQPRPRQHLQRRQQDSLVDIQGRPLQIMAEVVGHSPLLAQLAQFLPSAYSSSNSTSTAATSSSYRDAVVIQLHYGCHTIAQFTANMICFQTEQPFSFLFVKNSSQYYWSHRIMSNAISIAVMSRYHKDVLLRRPDFRKQNVYVIPFYTKPYPTIRWRSASVIAFTKQLLLANFLQRRRTSRSIKNNTNNNINSTEMYVGNSQTISINNSKRDEQINKSKTELTMKPLNDLISPLQCSRWFDIRATMGMSIAQLRVLHIGYRLHLRSIATIGASALASIDMQSEDGDENETSAVGNENDHIREERFYCSCDKSNGEVWYNFTRFAFLPRRDMTVDPTVPACVPLSTTASHSSYYLKHRYREATVAYTETAGICRDSYSCAYQQSTANPSLYLREFASLFSPRNVLLRRSRSLVFDEMPTDFFFFGYCSGERHSKLRQAHAYSNELGLRGEEVCTLGWPTSIFDGDLQMKLMSSRTILNLHSYASSSLQTHRLLYLFSLGKCIVSQRSGLDASSDDVVRDGVLFGSSIEELMGIVDVIANDRLKQYMCEYASLKVGQRVDKDTAELSRMIEDAVRQVQRRAKAQTVATRY